MTTFPGSSPNSNSNPNPSGGDPIERARQHQREDNARALAQQYARSGRSAEIQSPAFSKELASMNVKTGVATPEEGDLAQASDYDRIQQTRRMISDFIRQDLATGPNRAYVGSNHERILRQTAFAAAGVDFGSDYSKSERALREPKDSDADLQTRFEAGRANFRRQFGNARLKAQQQNPSFAGNAYGSAGYADELKAALAGSEYAKSSDFPKPEKEKPTPSQSQLWDDMRRNIGLEVRDEYASDPDKMSAIDSPQMRMEQIKRRLARNVGTDQDRAEMRRLTMQRMQQRLGLSGVNRGMLLTNAYAGFRGAEGILHGSEHIGKAVGDLAGGLMEGVTRSAAGFVAVGDTILDLILSPFGRSGRGIQNAVQGLSHGLLGAAGAGGRFIGSGIQLAGGIGAGLIGGGAGLVGGLAGGLVGAGIGGLVSGGAGIIPGMLTGSTVGIGVVGAGMSLLGDVVGLVSSTVGSAAKALGSAISDLGGTVGSVSTAIKDVVSDLIDSGRRYASAAAFASRNSGISLGAGGQYASLASILTGSPGGLNSFFSNFGTMAPYLGARARAFGVNGVNPNDPMGFIQKTFNRYQELGSEPMGSVRQRILLGGLPAGIGDQLGGLFSAGPQAVNLALSTARQNAMSPQETRQNLMLGIQLSSVQEQLDRIKTKFLSDLLPAIEGGLGLVTNYFTRNEKGIVSGLERIGRFLYVQFPSMLDNGLQALFSFGKKFAQALPQIFDTGLHILTSMVGMIQNIAGSIGGNALLKHFAPALATDLTGFASSDLIGTLEGSGNSKYLNRQAANLVTQAQTYKDSDPAKYQALINQAADLREQARQASNPEARVRQWSGGLSTWMDNAGKDAHRALSGVGLGADGENQRAKDWDTHFKMQAHNQQTINFNATFIHHHDIDLDKLQSTTTTHIARQTVQAQERAGA